MLGNFSTYMKMLKTAHRLYTAIPEKTTNSRELKRKKVCVWVNNHHKLTNIINLLLKLFKVLI